MASYICPHPPGSIYQLLVLDTAGKLDHCVFGFSYAKFNVEMLSLEAN